MPSLKDFRDRIASVKSTRKITSAMKMVAASKLKKAQDQAEASQPYAVKMAEMLGRLAENVASTPDAPKLLAGTGKDDVHLLVVVTSDRGLCGGFNGFVVRKAVQKIKKLRAEGKTVKIMCVGKKGVPVLRREFGDMIIDRFPMMDGKQVAYSDAEKVSSKVLTMFEAGEFDVCTIVYNRFQSVIAQVPTELQLIPFAVPETAANENDVVATQAQALYEFEPNEEEILKKLLPFNIGVQTFRTMLDSAAGEQAARMTAMDNATRNAGEMINDLSLQYNRARQAFITKELIEIISGAEAL